MCIQSLCTAPRLFTPLRYHANSGYCALWLHRPFRVFFLGGQTDTWNDGTAWIGVKIVRYVQGKWLARVWQGATRMWWNSLRCDSLRSGELCGDEQTLGSNATSRSIQGKREKGKRSDGITVSSWVLLQKHFFRISVLDPAKRITHIDQSYRVMVILILEVVIRSGFWVVYFGTFSFNSPLNLWYFEVLFIFIEQFRGEIHSFIYSCTLDALEIKQDRKPQEKKTLKNTDNKQKASQRVFRCLRKKVMIYMSYVMVLLF